MLGFVFTRHVVSEASNRYWNECYRMIRKFYPETFIMIIDDNSDYQYVKLEDQSFTNVMILQSEFKGAGEILAYYYYYKYRPFSHAVILHDSVFLQKYIGFEREGDIRFLWHFRQHGSDDIQTETTLLGLLDHSDEILPFYHQKHLWAGCFGGQCFISLSFLERVQNKYKLFRIIPHIHDRISRYAIERIIGCLFSFELPILQISPSIFGNIYEWVLWGYTYDQYQQDKGTLNKDIVKVWSGR